MLFLKRLKKSVLLRGKIVEKVINGSGKMAKGVIFNEDS
jgi:hypothetical protein